MRQWQSAALVAVASVCAVAAEGDKAKATDTAKVMAGRCHCGHVKYEARGPVTKCSSCDCRGCQRATGTLKAPFVTVKPANFKITAGEPTAFKAKNGKMCDAYGSWHFCAKCGTHLFWKPDNGKQIDVFAGTLDDTTVFKPKK